MNNNLDILLEQLKSEIHSLELSLNKCASEWDFERAQSFKSALLYTRRKYEILKLLENPNNDKINQLSEMIIRMENTSATKHFNHELFDKQMIDDLEDKLQKDKKEMIGKLKIELQQLKSSNSNQKFDDLNILDLFYKLNEKSISKLQFELVSNEIYLELNRKVNSVIMKLVIKNNSNIDKIITNEKKSILKQLDFDTTTYSKVIKEYNEADKLKILEDLSIITYEIFNLVGNQKMNIIVE